MRWSKTRIATPILLGHAARIQERARDLGLSLHGMQIVEPSTSQHREAYAQELFRPCQRRGVTLREAESLIRNRNILGTMMVHMGDADARVSGITQHYPDTLRPALQILHTREGLHRVSGCYAVITRKGEAFFLATPASTSIRQPKIWSRSRCARRTWRAVSI